MNVKRDIFIWICFLFTVGIIHISTGSLTPFLLEAFNKTTDDISVIIFFQFTGFLSGVLIAPLMIKKYSHFRTLTLALTIMLVALSIFFSNQGLVLYYCNGFSLRIWSRHIRNDSWFICYC